MMLAFEGDEVVFIFILTSGPFSLSTLLSTLLSGSFVRLKTL
jgi:uncharacterized membrane protein YciS (DUF1049 family)